MNHPMWFEQYFSRVVGGGYEVSQVQRIIQNADCVTRGKLTLLPDHGRSLRPPWSLG